LAASLPLERVSHQIAPTRGLCRLLSAGRKISLIVSASHIIITLVHGRWELGARFRSRDWAAAGKRRVAVAPPAASARQSANRCQDALRTERSPVSPGVESDPVEAGCLTPPLVCVVSTSRSRYSSTHRQKRSGCVSSHFAIPARNPCCQARRSRALSRQESPLRPNIRLSTALSPRRPWSTSETKSCASWSISPSPFRAELSRFGAYLEEIRELAGTRLGSASRTSPGPGAISSASIANRVGRPRVPLPTPPPPSTTRRRKVFRRRI
jgi:hypothetical protein